jgi:hypothetical protein
MTRATMAWLLSIGWRLPRRIWFCVLSRLLVPNPLLVGGFCPLGWVCAPDPLLGGLFRLWLWITDWFRPLLGGFCLLVGWLYVTGPLLFRLPDWPWFCTLDWFCLPIRIWLLLWFCILIERRIPLVEREKTVIVLVGRHWLIILFYICTIMIEKLEHQNIFIM